MDVPQRKVCPVVPPIETLGEFVVEPKSVEDDNVLKKSHPWLEAQTCAVPEKENVVGEQWSFSVKDNMDCVGSREVTYADGVADMRQMISEESEKSMYEIFKIILYWRRL